MQVSRDQFEKLALAELDTLYRMARRLTGDAHRAEDLVQETYVRAVGAYKNFRLESFGIRPWLLPILPNLHLTRSERESRQPRAIENDLLDGHLSDHGPSLPIDPASLD